MEKFKTLESPSGSPSKPPTPSPSSYPVSGKSPKTITNETIAKIPEPIPKEPDYVAPTRKLSADSSKSYEGLSPFERNRQLVIDREKVSC